MEIDGNFHGSKKLKNQVEWKTGSTATPSMRGVSASAYNSTSFAEAPGPLWVVVAMRQCTVVLVSR